METFFTFLEKRVDDCSSLLCVGLDPHVSELSMAAARPTPASALDFCLNLVKQTAPYAAAFKPNAAFFEVFGRRRLDRAQAGHRSHRRRVKTTRFTHPRCIRCQTR